MFTLNPAQYENLLAGMALPGCVRGFEAHDHGEMYVVYHSDVGDVGGLWKMTQFGRNF